MQLRNGGLGVLVGSLLASLLASLVACGGGQGNADSTSSASAANSNAGAVTAAGQTGSSSDSTVGPSGTSLTDPTTGTDASASSMTDAGAASSAAATTAASTSADASASSDATIAQANGAASALGSSSGGTTNAATLAAASATTSGFGITASSTSLTVTTGAGLVFDVDRTNGNITSIHYNNGPQLQLQTAGSHIGSGLGNGTAVSYSVTGNVAKVTLSTPTLIHYLLVRSGENNIYMGTYVTAEPAVGELRWITRLNSSVLTNVPAESDLRGNTGAIESKDIFGMADGTTRSKYYGNQRAIDYTLRGVTGNGVGVFMAYGNRETSSGGPFYRDIQNQTGGATEVYNYMNSGHSQTEAWRTGFNGPYALLFTDGSTPAAIPDMSWMGDYGLTGWVGKDGRGRVIGNGLKNRDPNVSYTVAFANDMAQYWTTASGANGSFGSYNMKPGSYAMTVYKGELAVYSEQVNVSAGTPTTLNTRTITNDPAADAAIWRIGVWDGTPNEFRNGPSINLRHPSDTRNASWGPVTFAVGSPNSLFPAVQWKAVNGTTKVTFSLTAAQIANHTVRIGITDAYAGGRPNIAVNAWSPSKLPAASTQPDSRTFTTGSYRGNNTLYTFDVPASAFVVGNNTMTISVTSGSDGTGYLSPAFGYDAVDLL